MTTNAASTAESPKPRIYADFMKEDDFGRLVLVCRGTMRDFERLGLSPYKGMEVVFYMDDLTDDGKDAELEADGVIQYDDEKRRWVGVYNSDSIRHVTL